MTPDQRRRRQGRPDNQGTPLVISPLTPTLNAIADKATGILTLTGLPLAAEIVTIDSKVYTWRAAIEAAAAGILTFGANPLDGEIVTIDSKVYTFLDDIAAQTDGLVHIGAAATDSLDNLIAAITLGAGSGTDYGSSMTLHPTVTAAAGAGDTMDATAKTAGVGGNSIVSTTNVTSGSWGAGTLAGGDGAADGDVLIAGDASDSIDNLIAAMTLGAGSGTTYALAMTLHPTVTATAGAGDTMDAEAKTGGEAGNTIVSTEGLTNGSWGATTLAGGSESGAIAAAGILTFGANPLDTEIVTIGSKVYTFLDDISAQTDGLVHIGATASDSLDNLLNAIDLGPGSGTDYGSSMTLHPDVDAAAGAGDTMDVTAEVPGDEGNSIVSTTDVTSGSWGAATLENGADSGGVITQQMTQVRTLFDKDVSDRGGYPVWVAVTPAVATVSQPNDADGDGVVEDKGGLVSGVAVGTSDIVVVFPGSPFVSTEATVE